MRHSKYIYLYIKKIRYMNTLGSIMGLHTGGGLDLEWAKLQVLWLTNVED